MDEKTPYEKMIEGVNQLALLVKSYYDALIGQGFSQEYALRLTIEYQKDVFGKALTAGENKDKKK